LLQNLVNKVRLYKVTKLWIIKVSTSLSYHHGSCAK